MHDMSLCEGILQVLEEQATVQQYHRVKTVWLEVGALSTIDIPAMEFSFDVVCRNTLADGCQLTIVPIPGNAWCMQCASHVEIQQRYDACPQCGSYQLQITQGEEMRIKELEVE